MNIFKNWKQMYQTELENRKLYEKRYNEVIQENIDLQKKKGYAKLRKQLCELYNENDRLKEIEVEYKRTLLHLEDVKGFLMQEREAKEALKKERTNLKREITKLKKKVNESGE